MAIFNTQEAINLVSGLIEPRKRELAALEAVQEILVAAQEGGVNDIEHTKSILRALKGK